MPCPGAVLMEIVIPSEILSRIADALAEAGSREIGGVLMGEHIGDNEFRICDLTVQSRGGSFSSFVRFASLALRALRAFFIRTKDEYTRFNYLGEWHSHPSFSTAPSDRDRETMQELVQDPRVGANFASLVIVRLDDLGEFEASATVFWPDGYSERAVLNLEGRS